MITWDAANKTATATVSNGGLTAATASDNFGRGSSTGPLPNGASVVEFTGVYFGELNNGEISVGLGLPGWDAANDVDSPVFLGGSALLNDGRAFVDGALVDLGLPYASGGKCYIKYDKATGFQWYDDEAGTYTADAEAGINPHVSYEPGTELWPFYDLWSADGVRETTITMNPAYSVGRFNAANSGGDSDMANDTMTDYDADGAIPVASGVARLTNPAPGVMTLASPVAGATALQLDILSASDYEQVVNGQFFDGGAFDELQFQKGGMVRLRSDGDAWYIAGINRGVTVR